MLVFALLAGVVGFCSLLSGLIHLRAWRSDSLASAQSLAAISWLLQPLLLGISNSNMIFKRVIYQYHHHNLYVHTYMLMQICIQGNHIRWAQRKTLSKRVFKPKIRHFYVYVCFSNQNETAVTLVLLQQTLETFIVISLLSQFLYVVLLHAGVYNSSYGPGYRNLTEDDHGTASVSMDDHHQHQKTGTPAVI